MHAAFSAGEALLSAQAQYDWGLRARMAAVRAAADASRRDAALTEAAAMLQGLRDVLVPGLVPPDRKILDGVLTDVFPGVSSTAPEAEAFGDALRDACGEMSLHLPEPWVAKVRASHVQLTCHAGQRCRCLTSSNILCLVVAHNGMHIAAQVDSAAADVFLHSHVSHTNCSSNHVLIGCRHVSSKPR